MRTTEFAESAISGVVADEPHSFKVWGYYAPEVRAMLRTDGVPFTDRRHWLLWRRFEVKAAPSVVLQVRRDLHELLDDDSLSRNPAITEIAARSSIVKHPIIVAGGQPAAEVRKLLSTQAVPHTKHWHWFLWTKFVVEGAPDYVRMVERSINDLMLALDS